MHRIIIEISPVYPFNPFIVKYNGFWGMNGLDGDVIGLIRLFRQFAVLDVVVLDA